MRAQDPRWTTWTRECTPPAGGGSDGGLLLVAGRGDQLVRYALSASSAPVAVADWASLPAQTRAVLPPADRIGAALNTSTLPAPGGESSS